jgi:hypothetical protein
LSSPADTNWSDGARLVPIEAGNRTEQGCDRTGTSATAEPRRRSRLATARRSRRRRTPSEDTIVLDTAEAVRQLGENALLDNLGRYGELCTTEDDKEVA